MSRLKPKPKRGLQQKAKKSRVEKDLTIDGEEVDQGVESEVGLDGGSIDEQLDTLFSDSWDSVEGKSFDDVPVGTYQGRIIAANLNNAKSSGRFQCSWEAIILDGDHRGRHVFKHDGLDTDDGISYFKGTLARLGYEQPTSKEELRTTLKEIVETPTYITFRVSSKKRKVDGVIEERTNVRFIRLLDESTIPDAFDETELQSYLTREDSSVSGDMDPNGSTEAGTTESEPEAAPSCTLKKGIKVKLLEQKLIKKIASQLGFEADNYDSIEQLLCELGDYCGMVGAFDNVTKLVLKIQKVVRA